LDTCAGRAGPGRGRVAGAFGTPRRPRMKAAVHYKPNMVLEVVDVEQQEPKAGEARVKVKAAGVCHSDWHIMNGDWPLPLPMVLGHEAAGIVEEVAPGGTKGKPRHPRIFC